MFPGEVLFPTSFLKTFTQCKLYFNVCCFLGREIEEVGGIADLPPLGLKRSWLGSFIAVINEDPYFIIGTLTPIFFAFPIARSYPASACLMIPMPGS